MNILFMIGNGFDINLGMKTSYSDFCKDYMNLPSENTAVEKLKKEMKNDDSKCWADLEIELGKYSSKVESVEEYIIVIKDILNKLREYLKKEINNYRLGDTKESLARHFFHFGDFFPDGNNEIANELMNKSEDNFVDIINFNYTNTIESIIRIGTPIEVEKRQKNGRYYSNEIRKIRHIHGTLSDTMLMGVNDEKQITEASIRTPLIRNCLVKPLMNDNSRTLRNKNCDKLINNANVIVIFGMSLGPTDKKWWNRIVEKILNTREAEVFIINHDSSVNGATKQYELEKYNYHIDKLLSYYEKNLSYEQKEELYSRIHVELNTKMFKFSCVNIKQSKKNLISPGPQI